MRVRQTTTWVRKETDRRMPRGEGKQVKEGKQVGERGKRSSDDFDIAVGADGRGLDDEEGSRHASHGDGARDVAQRLAHLGAGGGLNRLGREEGGHLPVRGVRVGEKAAAARDDDERAVER